jgi:hypothetical protein
MSYVSESVARPVRTAVQSGPGWIIIETIEAYELYDFTDRQYAITLLLLTMLFSFLQNAYENHRGKGLFLRNVPPVEVPVEGR